MLFILRSFSSDRRPSDSGVELLELEREWLFSRKIELGLAFFSLI